MEQFTLLLQYLDALVFLWGHENIWQDHLYGRSVPEPGRCVEVIHAALNQGNIPLD